MQCIFIHGGEFLCIGWSCVGVKRVIQKARGRFSPRVRAIFFKKARANFPQIYIKEIFNRISTLIQSDFESLQSRWNECKRNGMNESKSDNIKGNAMRTINVARICHCEWNIEQLRASLITHGG